MANRPESERIDSRSVDRQRDTWVDDILAGRQSPGSFIRAKTITDTINLGAVALQSGTRIEFDANQAKITNNEDANNLLSREYRSGWEI